MSKYVISELGWPKHTLGIWGVLLVINVIIHIWFILISYFLYHVTRQVHIWTTWYRQTHEEKHMPESHMCTNMPKQDMCSSSGMEHGKFWIWKLKYFMGQNIHLCPTLYISVVENYLRHLKWRKMWHGYLNKDECLLLAHFIQNYIGITLEKINISVFSKSTGRNSLLTGLISKAERPEYKNVTEP